MGAEGGLAGSMRGRYARGCREIPGARRPGRPARARPDVRSDTRSAGLELPEAALEPFEPGLELVALGLGGDHPLVEALDRRH